MDKKFPEHWMRSADATLDQIKSEQQAIQCQIKKDAAIICKRRKDMAKSLEEQVIKAESKRTELNGIIQEIRESLPAEKDPNVRRDIERSCLNLLNEIDDYISKLSSLQRRFANQKIRILSFGNKSQGKSTFTKAYTHLKDNVIETKGRGDEDLTGATSVIIHKKGIDAANPEISVVFKTPDQILKTVNECFNRLGLNVHYNSWSELYDVLDNTERKKQLCEQVEKLVQPETKIDGFISIKNMLLSIFNDASDFEDINSNNKDYFDVEKGKIISVDQLPEYNNMQNKKRQCYTSVSEIHIFADLQHEDMFENFEICDTKGTSIEAGGAMWEEELYKIMGDSDAVFSIQMTGSSAVGGQDLRFYENFNTELSKKGDLLKDMNLKHFAILNLVKDPNGANVLKPTKLIDKLEQAGIANTAYVGALKDGVVYENRPLHCQDFVDYIINHMMQEIVKTTELTDNNLLEECYKAISDINERKYKLVHLLDIYENITPPNKEDITRDAIRQWLTDYGCPEVNKILKIENLPLDFFPEPSDSQQSDTNTSYWIDEDDEDDECDTSETVDVKDIEAPIEHIQYKRTPVDKYKEKETLYQMITGKKSMPKELKTNDIHENTIIKAAIKDLYYSIKSKIGKNEGEQWINPMGCVHNIGAYIDSVAKLMRDQIMENINYGFAPSTDVPGSQDFKDEIFKQVWNALKLNIIYQEFDGKLLTKSNDEKLNNERLDHWSDGYNAENRGGLGTTILGCPSFLVLKYYFDLVSLQSNNEFGSILRSGDKVIADEDKLIEALQQVYIKYELAERCRQKQNKIIEWKTKIVQFLYSDKELGSFKSQMIDLYKYVCPNDDVYVRKLTEAGILNETIEEEYKNQSSIAKLKDLRTRLSSFAI